MEDTNGNKTFTTDENGEIVLPNSVKPGKYDVYEDGTRKIGSFTVENTCDALIKPSSSGGGGSSGSSPKDEDKSKDPTNNEENENPEESEELVEPGEKEDPKDPVDSENTEDATDLNGQEDSNESTDNQDGENNNPSIGSKEDSDLTNPELSGNIDKQAQQTDKSTGQTLPLTGEELNIKFFSGGILFIIVGMSLLFFRRIKHC